MNDSGTQHRNLVILMNMTLDGVIQAPGRPDEDPRGGFPFGGWAVPFAAMQSKEALAHMPQTGPLLLGRRTYQAMYDFWPRQTNNPFTDLLNNTEKYVASRTMPEPLPWVNSTLLHGDVAEAVTRLKTQQGKDILVMGSGELTQTLFRHNLVDLLILLIHPLVLGTGCRLFTEGLPCAAFRLVDASKTTNDVLVASYQPAKSEPRKEIQ